MRVKRWLAALLAAAATTGCVGHQDLKAPCQASVGAAVVVASLNDCGPRRPLNIARVEL